MPYLASGAKAPARLWEPMKDATNPLNELKHALEALPPRDLSAWTEWVEGRLTERLRQRQEARRSPSEPGATVPTGSSGDKETNDA